MLLCVFSQQALSLKAAPRCILTDVPICIIPKFHMEAHMVNAKTSTVVYLISELVRLARELGLKTSKL